MISIKEFNKNISIPWKINDPGIKHNWKWKTTYAIQMRSTPQGLDTPSYSNDILWNGLCDV